MASKRAHEISNEDETNTESDLSDTLLQSMGESSAESDIDLEFYVDRYHESIRSKDYVCSHPLHRVHETTSELMEIEREILEDVSNPLADEEIPFEDIVEIKAISKHTRLNVLYKDRAVPHRPSPQVLYWELKYQGSNIYLANFCYFCRKIFSFRVYSSHNTLDNDGNVICPALQRVVCFFCGATGDKAHISECCPYKDNQASTSK